MAKNQQAQNVSVTRNSNNNQEAKMSIVRRFGLSVRSIFVGNQPVALTQADLDAAIAAAAQNMLAAQGYVTTEEGKIVKKLEPVSKTPARKVFRVRPRSDGKPLKASEAVIVRFDYSTTAYRGDAEAAYIRVMRSTEMALTDEGHVKPGSLEHEGSHFERGGRYGCLMVRDGAKADDLTIVDDKTGEIVGGVQDCPDHYAQHTRGSRAPRLIIRMFPPEFIEAAGIVEREDGTGTACKHCFKRAEAALGARLIYEFPTAILRNEDFQKRVADAVAWEKAVSDGDYLKLESLRGERAASVAEWRRQNGLEAPTQDKDEEVIIA